VDQSIEQREDCFRDGTSRFLMHFCLMGRCDCVRCVGSAPQRGRPAPRRRQRGLRTPQRPPLLVPVAASVQAAVVSLIRRKQCPATHLHPVRRSRSVPTAFLIHRNNSSTVILPPRLN